jgi:hypothetical protein
LKEEPFSWNFGSKVDTKAFASLEEVTNLHKLSREDKITQARGVAEKLAA